MPFAPICWLSLTVLVVPNFVVGLFVLFWHDHKSLRYIVVYIICIMRITINIPNNELRGPYWFGSIVSYLCIGYTI